jgi:hypothetical protein
MTIPKRPEPGRLADQALLRLLRGEAITHREHDKCTASYRLAACICALRGKGWTIEPRPEAARTRTGRIARFGRYRIPEQQLRVYLANPEVKHRLGKEVQK